MDEIPEGGDERLAFLERWAARRGEEEQKRLQAEEISRVLAQARQRIGELDSLREVAVLPVVITKAPDLPADRATVFADLMRRLQEYEWADPVVSECPEPRDIAPNAIDLARRHRPDAPWLLYMEDDVILGPEFGLLPGLLSEAAELCPQAGIVSFYSGWIDTPGWSIHPMNLFGWLQCAAIRNTDYLADFRAFVDCSVNEPAKQFGEVPDASVQAFLAAEYDTYALWCPSLVQHADVTSALFGQPRRRRISSSYNQAYG